MIGWNGRTTFKTPGREAAESSAARIANEQQKFKTEGTDRFFNVLLAGC
jgi:hypothetical protein